jgi:hypothetical protein
MTTLNTWAARWGVSAAAVADLRNTLVSVVPPAPDLATPGRSEAAVQAAVRVAASRAGMRVWRNNVGAIHDPEAGVHIRYGLANDSAQVNAVVKSADLIGIRPRVILPADVGHTIGQFVSYECKHEGWRFTGSPRERAQEAWARLVVSLGGEARFVASAADVK